MSNVATTIITIFIVVFLAIMLLSFIIVLLSKMTSSRSKDSSGSVNGNQGQDSSETIGHIGFIRNVDTQNDSELIAVLTAAVNAFTSGSPDSKFIVRSYRRIQQSSPIWNTISRKEQILGSNAYIRFNHKK